MRVRTQNGLSCTCYWHANGTCDAARLRLGKSEIEPFNRIKHPTFIDQMHPETRGTRKNCEKSAKCRGIGGKWRLSRQSACARFVHPLRVCSSPARILCPVLFPIWVIRVIRFALMSSRRLFGRICGFYATLFSRLRKMPVGCAVCVSRLGSIVNFRKWELFCIFF